MPFVGTQDWSFFPEKMWHTSESWLIELASDIRTKRVGVFSSFAVPLGSDNPSTVFCIFILKFFLLIYERNVIVKKINKYIMSMKQICQNIELKCVKSNRKSSGANG